MHPRLLSYQNTMVIVHGLSELTICKSIKSNLRLPQELISRDNGRHSIQITSVMSVLNDSRFRSFAAFTRSFPAIEHQKKELKNFQLFIIMDTDDCTVEQKADFVSGAMFRDHWLSPYIVPIYNSPNLEATMRAANIPITRKKEYITIFPMNNGDLDIARAKELLGKLKDCPDTNMDTYIETCIQLAERNRFHTNKA